MFFICFFISEMDDAVRDMDDDYDAGDGEIGIGVAPEESISFVFGGLKAGIVVAPEERITPKRLTKFEIAKLVGQRAVKIANGDNLYLDEVPKFMEPLKIAWTEILQKKLQCKIKRSLPDGSIEMFDLQEMEIGYDEILDYPFRD